MIRSSYLLLLARLPMHRHVAFQPTIVYLPKSVSWTIYDTLMHIP